MNHTTITFSESVVDRVKMLGASHIIKSTLFRCTRAGLIAAMIMAFASWRLRGYDLESLIADTALGFGMMFGIRFVMALLWRIITIGSRGLHISHGGWWELHLQTEDIKNCQLSECGKYATLTMYYRRRKDKRETIVIKPGSETEWDSVRQFALTCCADQQPTTGL